jgi:hypothetical protein
MKDEKLLEEYSHLLDEIAWYNKGDVIQLAKMAKKLGRDYMRDLAERKSALVDIAADDETAALEAELVEKMKRLGASDEQVSQVTSKAKQQIISALFYDAVRKK